MSQAGVEEVTDIHSSEQDHSNEEGHAQAPVAKRTRSASGCYAPVAKRARSASGCYAPLQIKTVIKKRRQGEQSSAVPDEV